MSERIVLGDRTQESERCCVRPLQVIEKENQRMPRLRKNLDEAQEHEIEAISGFCRKKVRHWRLWSDDELNFRDNANPAKIPIQFLISVDPDEQSISTGTYNISRYISGFMNNFDGVFGYANLNMLGERPFFTRKGQLVITEKNNELVSGTLDVFLEAVNGESLHLQGSFRAIID